MAIKLSSISMQPKVKWPMPLKGRCISLVSLFCMGILLLILGYDVQSKNNSITDQIIPYPPECDLSGADDEKTCTFDLTIQQDMKQPIFVYYKLTKFYQNHRSFVMGASRKQMLGEDLKDTDNCDPEFTRNADDKIFVPCGVQGFSYFNDELEFQNILINASADIAMEPDYKRLNSKILNSNEFTRDHADQDVNGVTRYGFTMPVLDDPRFMNWLRMAVGPEFYKLYGKIDQDLTKDETIQVTITSRFNVASYGGDKTWFITEVDTLGGKHENLATLLLFFGWFALVYLILIITIYIFFKYIKPKETQFTEREL